MIYEDKQIARTIDKNTVRMWTLIRSGIFNSSPGENLLFQSAFIELVLCLSVLLQYVKEQTGDDLGPVRYVGPEMENWTLYRFVTEVRNAIAHPFEKTGEVQRRMKFQSNTLSWNIFVGQVNAIQINDTKLGSEFADEVAFNFGHLVVYLHRHLIRALVLATEALEIYRLRERGGA